MLDTVKLRLADYAIKPDANISIQPGVLNYASGECYDTILFQDTKGHQQRGAKAYINSDKYNLTFSPKGAFLQFSAPKVARGDNYDPANYDDLVHSQEILTVALTNDGVETDLDTAFVSRLDTTKNIETDEPFECYSRVFGLLGTKLKYNASFGTTWLTANSEREFCAYDKREEMNRRGAPTDQLPANVMRFEHRALKARKCKALYDVITLADLKDRGFDAIAKVNRSEWEHGLFKYDMQDVVIKVASSLGEELTRYQIKYGRHFVSMFLRDYGAYHLAGMVGDVDVMGEALKLIGCDRKKIYRAQKMINDARISIEAMKPEISGARNLADLYQELKEKVLA